MLRCDPIDWSAQVLADGQAVTGQEFLGMQSPATLQLQHILMLTGFPSIDYWAYVENRQPILLTIERDESYIARLFDAEKRFWDSLSEPAKKLLEQADASVSLRKAPSI